MGRYIGGFLVADEELEKLRREWFLELMEEVVTTELGDAVLVRSIER